MSLPIQKPYQSSSLFSRSSRKCPPISAAEQHTLNDLRCEAVTTASITLDGNEGEIRVEAFPKVTELTVTLVNAPSTTTIATALDQFTNLRILRITITPPNKAEPDSKKILKRRLRAERRTVAAPKGLSEALPHIVALYLTGWHEDICEWICSTTSGAIQWLDIIECGRSYAAPMQAELIQRLLDNNKWVFSMKMFSFYPLKLNFSHLVELTSVQITVAPHSESVTRASVATIQPSLKCSVMLVEPHALDLKKKLLDHTEAMKRPASDWSLELVVYGWG